MRTFRLLKHVRGRSVEDVNLERGIEDVHVTLRERRGGERHFLHSHRALAWGIEIRCDGWVVVVQGLGLGTVSKYDENLIDSNAEDGKEITDILSRLCAFRSTMYVIFRQHTRCSPGMFLVIPLQPLLLLTYIPSEHTYLSAATGGWGNHPSQHDWIQSRHLQAEIGCPQCSTYQQKRT